MIMGQGGLHHVELWVPDLTRAVESWGWLFDALGWQPYQHWDAGRSWRSGGVYVVVRAAGTAGHRCSPTGTRTPAARTTTPPIWWTGTGSRWSWWRANGPPYATRPSRVGRPRSRTGTRSRWTPPWRCR